jgi:hypothetical protein
MAPGEIVVDGFKMETTMCAPQVVGKSTRYQQLSCTSLFRTVSPIVDGDISEVWKHNQEGQNMSKPRGPISYQGYELISVDETGGSKRSNPWHVDDHEVAV